MTDAEKPKVDKTEKIKLWAAIVGLASQLLRLFL